MAQAKTDTNDRPAQVLEDIKALCQVLAEICAAIDTAARTDDPSRIDSDPDRLWDCLVGNLGYVVAESPESLWRSLDRLHEASCDMGGLSAGSWMELAAKLAMQRYIIIREELGIIEMRALNHRFGTRTIDRRSHFNRIKLPTNFKAWLRGLDRIADLPPINADTLAVRIDKEFTRLELELPAAENAMPIASTSAKPSTELLSETALSPADSDNRSDTERKNRARRYRITGNLANCARDFIAAKQKDDSVAKDPFIREWAIEHGEPEEGFKRRADDHPELFVPTTFRHPNKKSK